MVYTPAVTQEHTATERSWTSATQQQQQPSRSAIQKRSNNGITIAHPEPVVKRTVTVQDLSYPEPMQGLLIIQSDSEDDDDDDDNERISSSSSSSSSNSNDSHDDSQNNHIAARTPLVETVSNQPVKTKKKPLPPVPLFVPDLHGDTTFDQQQQQQQEQEGSAITPESPFLMIPTPLEPIQESLDSTIEDEVALYQSDDDDDESASDDVAHDEKTTTENVSSDDCNQHDTITATLEAPAVTHQSDIVSVASSTHTQKPFEPGPAQTPHTPEEAQPATIWSVDNSASSIRTSDEDDQHSLRRRASKEELPPPINTQLTSNVSLCSRCSSISSAPSSAVSMLSHQDILLRAAASASPSHIPRTASAISLGSTTSSSRPMSHVWEPHQQPLMLPPNNHHHQQPLAFQMQQQASPIGSPLHKAQSTPHLATTAATNNAAAVDALLQPVPVKSRLSIASFSLTHDKDAIKTYRRMASKTHNKAIQLTYAKYLLDVARLYKSNQSTRERLLSEAGYWIERLAKAGLAEALFIKGKWHLQQPEIEECDQSYRSKPQPLKAYKCFQAAARAGWVDAYYELARYQKSRGEYARAVDCYKLAASKGHTLATYVSSPLCILYLKLIIIIMVSL